MFQRYHLPYYRMRVEQIKAARKFVHIHMDGSLKPLLPFLRQVPWDGIEAATPVPQGDLVLLDGIPTLYFLPHYPEEALVECVKRLVELFYPRLILGISDELPPDGDIERVKLVGHLVEELVTSQRRES
jgi:hypothetical protein